MQYRWKLLFKDNQLDLIEIPKKVVNTNSGESPIKE
jgi:hypothetical protein